MPVTATASKTEESEKKENQPHRPRLPLLDSIRGLTLISMILFHASWDAVYLFGLQWDWFNGTGALIWQQSICCTFILLSGFCRLLGSHPFKRGAVVFVCGVVVSVVTALFMPQELILFGILTLMGSCMLLMSLLRPLTNKIPPVAGLIGSGILFILLRNVSRGYIGISGLRMFELPSWLYKGMVGTFFGFPDPNFFSTDYFPLLPWLFLFAVGEFLYRILEPVLYDAPIMQKHFRPLSFLGRHSLLIYLLHQPVVYGLMLLVNLAFSR